MFYRTNDWVSGKNGGEGTITDFKNLRVWFFRLTVTRGEKGGTFRGKGCRVCRNNYKGHMDNNGAQGGGNRMEVGRAGG